MVERGFSPEMASEADKDQKGFISILSGFLNRPEVRRFLLPLLIATASVQAPAHGAESTPDTDTAITESADPRERRNAQTIGRGVVGEFLGTEKITEAEYLEDALQRAYNPEMKGLGEESDQEILTQFLIELNNIIQNSGIEGENKDEYLRSLYSFGVNSAETAIGVNVKDALDKDAPTDLSPEVIDKSLFGDAHNKTVSAISNFSSRVLLTSDQRADRNILETAEIAEGDNVREKFMVTTRQILSLILKSSYKVVGDPEGADFQGQPETTEQSVSE